MTAQRRARPNLSVVTAPNKKKATPAVAEAVPPPPAAAAAAAAAASAVVVVAASPRRGHGSHVTQPPGPVAAAGSRPQQRFFRSALRQPLLMRVALFTIAAAIAAASARSVNQLLLPNLAALRNPHALAAIPGNTPLETCLDDEAQLVQIDELYVEPFPPAPGENLTVSAKGTVEQDITDGAYVDVLVRYGFITLVNRRYDLCELLPEVELECPVKSGFLSLSRVIELPENVPPGEYSVEVKAFNAGDELLTCITGTIDMDS